MKLHHIGIAVKDLQEEIFHISSIHEVVHQSPVLFDQEQQAQLVLLTLSDGTKMELVSGKPVESFVKKNISFYHLCFEVDDLDQEIARLTGEGAFLISPPKPAILFTNRLVAFLQVSYGMIELLNSR
jgi:methylmalonyl-CoA/ethylmalonyl-CoA epimerase